MQTMNAKTNTQKANDFRNWTILQGERKKKTTAKQFLNYLERYIGNRSNISLKRWSSRESFCLSHTLIYQNVWIYLLLFFSTKEEGKKNPSHTVYCFARVFKSSFTFNIYLSNRVAYTQRTGNENLNDVHDLNGVHWMMYDRLIWFTTASAEHRACAHTYTDAGQLLFIFVSYNIIWMK